MSQRRWFNPNVPQTLYVAQFLLYFDAFWALLGIFTLVAGSGVLGVLALAAYVYGAYGIANEQKRGYQVAVFAAFLPFLLRLHLLPSLRRGRPDPRPRLHPVQQRAS